MTSSPLFEVRMPTCDRPQMLRRALDSLIAQTYPQWRAEVFDDSSTEEARDVVAAFADPRIRYVRNRWRFGAGRNIDQGFFPGSRTGGDYGCLLEDDNYWLPDYLQLLCECLAGGWWQLLMANQRVHVEGIGLDGDRTTRGGWFLDGIVQPLELRGSLFLMEGVSNGGLVWKLGANVDLRVGEEVEHGLHEHSRSLLVDRPFLFVDQAAAVWTEMPREATARSTDRNRMINRGIQSIRDHLLRVHGREVVAAANVVARRKGCMDELCRALAYNGRLRRVNAMDLIAAAKGLALRITEPDPSRRFLLSQAV
jgi:glycosyltransferase involved in cell wall biosynthesis